MMQRLYTRRCRGCLDRSPHTHHLTWLGRLHYIGWRRPAKRLP
jgi:hypothetical protein